MALATAAAREEYRPVQLMYERLNIISGNVGPMAILTWGYFDALRLGCAHSL